MKEVCFQPSPVIKVETLTGLCAKIKVRELDIDLCKKKCKIHLKGNGCPGKFKWDKKGGSSSEIVASLYARISVMEKLRPQPRDKNR